jgi:hypothetical protein
LPGKQAFMAQFLTPPIGEKSSLTDDLYLCQVNDNVSCAACCGLYNLRDSSFLFILEMLARRSVIYSSLKRDMDSIIEFGEKESGLLGDLPMPEFHHCPYIGFIDSGNKRVGCLLHPNGNDNNGIDYRGLSYYGSMTCRTYFCPSHRRLDNNFMQILFNQADNWYEYGLMIPETDLLELCYRQIVERTGHKIDSAAGDNRKFGHQLKNLMTLKVRWPYRATNRPMAHYFFNDPLYQKPPVDYWKAGGIISRYDDLFRELHSEFKSEQDLKKAEKHLDNLFDSLAEHIRLNI